MTYEEFLAQADEDHPAEWVDGEIIPMSPASIDHQKVCHLLATVLGLYVEHHDLGQVIPPPFQMKLRDDLPGREPDLIFVAEEHRDRIQTAFLNGPADLVVEVISLESRARDRGDKFYEYEQGGVPEYWLLDPIRRIAEFYQLDPAGIYQSIRAEDGVYRSRAIRDLWIRSEWLWQDPLPRAGSIVKEWRLL